MLEYTPVHIAYGRPFQQKAEVTKNELNDVSADRAEDVLEVNFRMDLSHLILINLFLNVVMTFLLLRLARK